MSNAAARWAVCLAVTAAAVAAPADGPAAPRAARPAVVPVSSLEPAATARLWRRLVSHPRILRVATDCRPLRSVFYAATDWLRLATKLAQSASPCAQYYVSIPPLVGDKTKPRPDQAWRIRALGPSFHALAEIHFATWNRWVADTGSTWYAAGVEARRRMAEAGYDVSKGDTWAVNEFPSSVRTNAGATRANVRDFVHGLYDSDGAQPVRGAVFVIGVGQATPDVSLYQTNLQNWLADSAFWADMASYVGDWSQEVYPDVRNYAVPGAPLTTRRDYLNDYLQHERVLAGVGPPTIEPARAYLSSAYSPLANAAWQWDFGYGWTMVPLDQMQAFVSAQTYALRFAGATSGQAQDHWGFAWAPRNAAALSAADFAAQTGALLDRLAAAIRDSGSVIDPADPGSGACGPPGQNVWCGGDLAGARLTETWKSFRTWTQPVLAFATPPQTLQAGAPSAAMTLALLTSTGAPQVTAGDVAVNLSSSSTQGQFSTAPTGPWSSTLTLTIPAGAGTAGPFYYLDTQAGSPVLTATAFGITSGTQTETVVPGPAASLRVVPASARVAARRSQRFTVTGADAFGNVVPVTASWSLAPPELGSVTPQSGAATTFVAAARAGIGTVTAAAGSLSGSAAVTVTPGPIRVSSIRYGIGRNAVLVTARVIDAGRRPVAGALVSVLVRLNGHRFFSGRKATDATGRAVFRLRPRRGCYRTSVTRVSAAGYRWVLGAPSKRFCK